MLFRSWTVDYAITATVTPVMTEDMRQDMKAQIIAEISGGWTPRLPDNNPNTITRNDSERPSAKNKQQDAESFWQP